MGDPKVRVSGPSAIVNPGGPNQFAWFDSTNTLGGLPQWFISPTTNGAQVSMTQNVINNGYHDLHSFYLGLDPSVNSPTTTWGEFRYTLQFDPNNTGNDIGTGGQAGRVLTLNFNHQGKSNTGSIVSLALEGNLGNGTDPISVKGVNCISQSLGIADNVTIDGQIQAFGFNISGTALTTLTANANAQIFFDSAQLMNTDLNASWTSANFQPNFKSIANTQNYQGCFVGPNITTLHGNAGVFCHGAFGTIGTMGATSSYIAYNAGCNITTSHGNITGTAFFPSVAGGDANVTLFSGGMGSVTTTGATTVLNLNGQTATGAMSSLNIDGVRTNISGIMIAQSSAGVQGQHVIFTQSVLPNSTTITGTDVIVNILSPDVDFGDASSYLQIGPSGLGYNFVGFAGQMHGHGKMDLCSAVIPTAIFAEDFTLTEWRNVNCNVVNAGYTGACTSATAFYHEVSGAGLFATTHWGLKVVTDGVENYVPKLAIKTADQKVYSDSLLSLGDQNLISGDIRGNIRNSKHLIDPNGYAVDAGISSYNSAEFTDNSSVAVIGIHNLTNAKVAAGKSIAGMAGIYNALGRADAGDDGNVPFAFGVLTSFTSGNSTTKTTDLYASYFAGFHSIDTNANQIAAMYDFYAQASSIGAGAVTTRYGIVIEPDASYTKQNWISGQLVVGGSSATPTNSSVGLEVSGTTQALLSSRMTTTEKNALTPVDGMQVYDTTLTKMQFRENGAWVGLGSGGSSTFNVRASEGGGTTTLVAGDNHNQLFDLTAGQVCVLPSTGVSAGDTWILSNPNPFRLTIQADDTTLILYSFGTATTLVALVNSPATFSDWKVVEKEILYGTGINSYTPTFPANVVVGTLTAWWTRESINTSRVHVGIQFGVGTVAAGTYTATSPSGQTIATPNVLGNSSPIGEATAFQAGNILFGQASIDSSTTFRVNTTYNVTSFSASGLAIRPTDILNAGDYIEFEAVIVVSEWAES